MILGRDGWIIAHDSDSVQVAKRTTGTGNDRNTAAPGLASKASS